MRWVYARPIGEVANGVQPRARVKHPLLARDLSNVQLPRHVMSQYVLPVPAEVAVSAFPQVALPQPAASLNRTNDHGKEPLGTSVLAHARVVMATLATELRAAAVDIGEQRDKCNTAVCARATNLFSHRKLTPSGARPPAVSAARGPLVLGLYRP